MKPPVTFNSEERAIVCSAVDKFGFSSLFYYDGCCQIRFLYTENVQKFGKDAISYLTERIPKYTWTCMSNEEWFKRNPMPEVYRILSYSGWRKEVVE